MTHLTGDAAIPDPAQHAALNAALLTDTIETGFWDEHGRPAPWPEDIDQWQPETSRPTTGKPDEQPI